MLELRTPNGTDISASTGLPDDLRTHLLEMTGEELERHLAGTNVVGYNCVAALAFLLYDILLTMEEEVRVIWPIPRSLTKYLYFFVRYFTVSLQISVLFVGTPPFTFTEYECYIWNVYQGLASTMIIAAVDYILVLRVFALYPRNRNVKYFVGIMYVLELVTISIGVGLAIPQFKVDELCTVLFVPDTFLISAGAPIAFQSFLFAFTAWEFIKAVKAGWGDVPILQLLMRDGTWAFILLFIILLGEAALYGFAPEAYTDVLYGWLNSVFAFCGYRVLLNLHNLNHAPSRRSIFTTTPEIQFTSNILTGNAFEDEEDSYQMTDFSRSRSEDRIGRAVGTT